MTSCWEMGAMGMGNAGWGMGEWLSGCEGYRRIAAGTATASLQQRRPRFNPGSGLFYHRVIVTLGRCWCCFTLLQ